MEPEPNMPQNTKSTQCPINSQLNLYRNSLPEIERSQNHFFFKQINHQGQSIAYVTIGYRVGQVPFQLMDLFAVVVNEIHCYADCNLKIILDDDQLWVTSTIGYSMDQINSHRHNVQQAHLSEALQKTQRLVRQFLEERKRQHRVADKIILQQVKNNLCKSIMLIFKNPNMDD